jgi:hypothetical protein
LQESVNGLLSDSYKIFELEIVQVGFIPVLKYSSLMHTVRTVVFVLSLLMYGAHLDYILLPVFYFFSNTLLVKLAGPKSDTL